MSYISKLLEDWSTRQPSIQLAHSQKPKVLRQYSGRINVSQDKQQQIKNPNVPRAT